MSCREISPMLQISGLCNVEGDLGIFTVLPELKTVHYQRSRLKTVRLTVRTVRADLRAHIFYFSTHLTHLLHICISHLHLRHLQMSLQELFSLRFTRRSAAVAHGVGRRTVVPRQRHHATVGRATQEELVKRAATCATPRSANFFGSQLSTAVRHGKL